jgi:hypothetical protein
MSRSVLIALAVLVIAVIGFFVFRGGGVDPGEALSDMGDAVESVAEGAADAVSGAADTASETAEGAADAVSGAMDSVGGVLEGAGIGDLSETLSGLDLEGFDTSLLDPASFDLDGLMQQLESAGLGGEAVANLRSALDTAAESPDMLADLLDRIRTALGV